MACPLRREAGKTAVFAACCRMAAVGRATDAGSGSGGFYASQVLEPLGADTSGSVLLDPDGHFPGHIPNPDEEPGKSALQPATHYSIFLHKRKYRARMFSYSVFVFLLTGVRYGFMMILI